MGRGGTRPYQKSPEQETTCQQRENRLILTKLPSGCACAPASLLRTVFGVSPILLTVELVYSQRAESNRNRTSPCAEQIQRTAEIAAGLIQIKNCKEWAQAFAFRPRCPSPPTHSAG